MTQSISIQQFLQTAPDDAAPGNGTHFVTFRDGAVRKVAYAVAVPQPTPAERMAELGIYVGTVEPSLGTYAEWAATGVGYWAWVDISSAVNAVTASLAVATMLGTAAPLTAVAAAYVTASLGVAQTTGSAVPISAEASAFVTASLGTAQMNGSVASLSSVAADGATAVSASLGVAHLTGSATLLTAEYISYVTASLGTATMQGTVSPLAAVASQDGVVNVMASLGAAVVTGSAQALTAAAAQFVTASLGVATATGSATGLTATASAGANNVTASLGTATMTGSAAGVAATATSGSVTYYTNAFDIADGWLTWNPPLYSMSDFQIEPVGHNGGNALVYSGGATETAWEEIDEEQVAVAWGAPYTTGVVFRNFSSPGNYLTDGTYTVWVRAKSGTAKVQTSITYAANGNLVTGVVGDTVVGTTWTKLEATVSGVPANTPLNFVVSNVRSELEPGDTIYIDDFSVPVG